MCLERGLELNCVSSCNFFTFFYQCLKIAGQQSFNVRLGWSTSLGEVLNVSVQMMLVFLYQITGNIR